MKTKIFCRRFIPILLLPLLITGLCFTSSCEQKDKATIAEEGYKAIDSAYVEFRAGNNEASKSISHQVLTNARDISNDSLAGRALMSLCRTALRDRDTIALQDYSVQLADLTEKTGQDVWMMVRAHMNAEMNRMQGNLDEAAALYDESMAIAKSIGSLGMYAAEHFNKSFIAVEQGEFEEAAKLIKGYFDIMKERNPDREDAYGLIALVNFLSKQDDLQGAATVAYTARRLFEQENIVPDPADETPMAAAELRVEKELALKVRDSILENTKTLKVSNLLERYLD
ncbi:hypothetical protein LVD13_13230 [Flavobacteriaceae bacterium D16]|nr:hypothetical protein [Flavobacteriaceae bacterium D16]